MSESLVHAPLALCTTDYPGTCIDAALIRAELLYPGALYSETFLEEENATMRRRAETFSQYKLPTYQAAAVVSTVLAGVESQLLVFFKSSPDFSQQPVAVILQYLLVLTYIALIFSVSTTISSLVLTRIFGNVPMLVGRLHEKIRGMSSATFGNSLFRTRSSEDIAPRRWRLLECHWLFTLVISVLCLPAQILLYTWTQERDTIRATISVAGVFAMLPLLHFLPAFWRGTGAKGKRNLPPFSRDGCWDGPDVNVLPAPPPSNPRRASSASQMSY